jgi:hypothetical protein
MFHVEIKSRVGADGVLTVSVPLGLEEANREVRVIVTPMTPTTEQIHLTTAMASERVLANDWLRFEEDEAWRSL